MDKYFQEYIITNDCMDKNYRIKPISVIMFFQDSFARFLTTKYLAAFHIIKENLYWVVSEFNIDFKDDLPFWSEKINVEIWISELSKLKIYADFRLTYKDKIFAEGNSCWYILDTNTKRPVSTDIIKDKIGVVSEFSLGEHKKTGVENCFEKLNEISHTINISDIDFNKHVNNKSYINIAETSFDEDYRNTHSVKNMHVKFIKESFLKDNLTCSLYKTGSPDYFVNKITKDGADIFYMTTKWEKISNNKSINDIDLSLIKKQQN